MASTPSGRLLCIWGRGWQSCFPPADHGGCHLGWIGAPSSHQGQSGGPTRPLWLQTRVQFNTSMNINTAIRLKHASLPRMPHCVLADRWFLEQCVFLLRNSTADFFFLFNWEFYLASLQLCTMRLFWQQQWSWRVFISINCHGDCVAKKRGRGWSSNVKCSRCKNNPFNKCNYDNDCGEKMKLL